MLSAIFYSVVGLEQDLSTASMEQSNDYSSKLFQHTYVSIALKKTEPILECFCTVISYMCQVLSGSLWLLVVEASIS